VYVERDLIVTADPGVERRRERVESLLPDALSTLALLADTHDLVVLTADPLPDVEGAAGLVTTSSLPTEHPDGAWLLTVDPAVCSGERPPGVRTILVGPRRPPDRRPTARCDLEARDLSAAVMEILVRDTMR
jgi:hypothetical protein